MATAQAITFSSGTINRTTLTLVANNTTKKYVLTGIHFAKRTGASPALALTLVRGGVESPLLPVNFRMMKAYALDVLDEGESLVLGPGENIRLSTDTIDALSYVVTGEVHENV